jgi:hypothetical protein
MFTPELQVRGFATRLHLRRLGERLAPGPQVRFLLRGSTLLIALLILWRLELQPPMLFLMQAGESFALRLSSNGGAPEPITIDQEGDWNFRIPVADTVRENTRGLGPVNLRDIQFTIPRPDVVLFTFSVPVFWAIVLAAPISGSCARVLLWGTAVVSLVEILSLFAQVQIIAYGAAAQLHASEEGLMAWGREVSTRLLIGVIPFAAPVLAAVALHRDLRSQLFAPPLHVAPPLQCSTAIRPRAARSRAPR